jgi:predicted metal-dependent HD superfamily phosphohydrolase
MVKEALKERWFKAWQEFQMKEGAGYQDRIWNLLESAYQQPHRYYHNLSHIHACLQFLDLAQAELGWQENKFYLCVEMALWFHDLVYHPQRKDNEAQSSQLFAEIASYAGVASEFSDRVIHLILLTKHHTMPTLPEEKLMSDCDLSILGTSADEYDLYASNIRQEYSFVEESVYREKRSQILQSFLTRENIFKLPYFHQTLEAQARENIERELKTLNQPFD